MRTSVPFLGIWFFLLLKGSRPPYGGAFDRWDTPALRGGDEVVTGAGTPPETS
jgi:hypothetical protein